MDKQLIERIALEVSGATPEDMHEEAWIKWFATRLIARIDAERGKSAVAWVDTLDTARPRCITNLDYRSVTEAKLGVEYVPLFLSPTIPEGMALVPKGINYLDDTPRPSVMKLLAVPPTALRREEEQDYYSRWWELLIAAAQGERK